jgi:hypothetical protein
MTETFVQAAVPTEKVSSSTFKRVGIVISALPVIALLMSSVIKLSHNEGFVKTFTGELGWPLSVLTGVGILELVCVVLYAIPRTAVLGAVLLTGYLGGAISAHVRTHQPFVIPLVLGVLVWVGLYLREPRLRALGPIRS